MKRITSLLLLIAIMLGICAVPASAANAQPLTEHFVDIDGVSISEPVASTAEEKDAKIMRHDLLRDLAIDALGVVNINMVYIL